MPIYMDVHIVPGVKAKDVAEAHRLDLLHQHEHGCNCMTYWIDEARENIFCLIEAPDKLAVEKMHSQAHGLIPNKIIEVNSSLVESFLGRIYDPSDAKVTDAGLKVFADPSFRIILVTKTADFVLLKHQLGSEKASYLVNRYNQIIRNNILRHHGSEAGREGGGFIVSFSSVTNAMACALAISNEMLEPGLENIRLRLAVNAGEPVAQSERLFGDTIQLAFNMCELPREGKIVMTSSVRALLPDDFLRNERNHFYSLLPNDENLLKLLFTILEEKWQQASFDITAYCKATAMSSSQLYRKAIGLTGLAPNSLLRDFRLHKAKELMRNQRYNIAQVTYEAGFTSASYFTKCFKKEYGLLPMAYLDLLD